jgi:glycosyltransferase involved in cell wall biosynthesis
LDDVVIEDGQTSRVTSRSLAGATILLAVPALHDDRIGRSTLNVALALLRSGARALVAGGEGPLVGELQAIGGEWMDIGFSSVHLFGRHRSVRRLEDILKTERVELVHAHGAEAARQAVAASKHTPIPVMATYVGLPTAKASLGLRADAFVRGRLAHVQSDYAASLLTREHNVPPDSIVVIPPVMDTAWFDAETVRTDRVTTLRHAWRIRGERVVLMPGRMAPWRNHLSLIDAVRTLVNGGLRDVVFVIAGHHPTDQHYEAEINERIAAQGLGGIFRTAGPCKDMPAAYAAADIVVALTERPKSFDNVAAEAQAMGRPVVASNIGALPEIVMAPPQVQSQDRTGWLVKPRDPIHLARALAAALALSPKAWDALGERARELAEYQYSPSQVAAATLGVYGSLMDRAAPARATAHQADYRR